MKIMCQAEGCGRSAEIPERPATARTAARKKAGFTRLMTGDSTILVCAGCHGKLVELAVKLVVLLKGQEVPLWQLIPAEKRSLLKNEDLRRGQRA